MTFASPTSVPLDPANLEADIEAWREELYNTLSSMWVLVAAFMVFFMQCGFALLEAGSIRYKNTRNILLKNTIETSVNALMWYICGQAFAHGECYSGSNSFIGTGNFASADAAQVNMPGYWRTWMFGWVFCAVSVTVVSGALAERSQLIAYVVYSVWQSGFVYPVIVHWTWSYEGWLSPFRVTCGTNEPDILFSGSVGLIDYAGSCNVHMTGGAAALVAAVIVGPRLGRFLEDGTVVAMPACNPTHQALGTFILWFGWYGFNPGSTNCAFGCMDLAAAIAVNTTLSAAAGGMTTLLLEILLGRPGDIGPVLNGILGGLVGITSGCAVVEAYGAVVIGIVSGMVYTASGSLLKKMRVDDPLDASPVHFFCGLWGCIAPGLLASKNMVEAAYGSTAGYGVFYGSSGTQLGVQILGAVSVTAWSACNGFILFYSLHKMGKLRVSPQEEEEGLDHTQGVGTGMPIWKLGVTKY